MKLQRAHMLRRFANRLTALKVRVSNDQGPEGSSGNRPLPRNADADTRPDLPSRQRHEYRATWTDLASTYQKAVAHVVGDVTDDQLRSSGEETRALLEATVGIRPDDTVLEIGCGVGRVGAAVAPLCREWIGCDVSPGMLAYASERLAGLDNVRFVELSGFDLKPIADASVDMVYCTIVFMHLDEWDRYSYVTEAYRVLRPGGRVYVDNFNLDSEEGWQVFELHRQTFPRERPAHISKASTPQEIEVYLRRAGFEEIQIVCDGLWVRGFGRKGQATTRPREGGPALSQPA